MQNLTENVKDFLLKRIKYNIVIGIGGLK